MMVHREVLKTIIQDYAVGAEDSRLEYLTDIVARELEITAFDLIRKLFKENSGTCESFTDVFESTETTCEVKSKEPAIYKYKFFRL